MTPRIFSGGGERVRTDGLLRARQALSQLSYTPDGQIRNTNFEIRKSIRFASRYSSFEFPRLAGHGGPGWS